MCISLLSGNIAAQVCDPTVAPTGLTSTYTPGVGALLQWTAVPGSIGVQVKATLPSGPSVVQRIAGFERNQFLVPDALLAAGTYAWRVQAACSTTPPYDVTPISESNSFVAGGTSGSCPASVPDIDGNVYQTVLIGSQCWMKENLKVELYRNGVAIPSGLSDVDWQSTFSGAFAVYNNISSNKSTYRLLYNWFAVDDFQGLCPSGWHVPADMEWTQLTTFLGGEFIAGSALKTTGTLTAASGLWLAPNTDATNSSGFSGLPGAYRDYFGTFNNQGLIGYWWSSSDNKTEYAWYRGLYYLNGFAARDYTMKQDGFSILCLQD